jgi:hypothetical protein
MAGHRKWERTYFVPRTLIPLENEVEWYCDKLLPDLKKWRSQARGKYGDKSSCCQKFLYEIIPYFVEVLVQDGVYLVKDFPKHPMSHLLKVSFYGLSNNFLFQSHRVDYCFAEQITSL